MAKEYIEREALRPLEEMEYTYFMSPAIVPYYEADKVWEILDNIPAADVVEVVRCQNCVHAEPFERNCELNSTAYMHCTRGRGEEVRNVWHKYKKYYRDYSVVDRDGYCDEGERRDNNATD